MNFIDHEHLYNDYFPNYNSPPKNGPVSSQVSLKIEIPDHATYRGKGVYYWNHSRYGPFPLWASRNGPHGGRYGPPR